MLYYFFTLQSTLPTHNSLHHSTLCFALHFPFYSVFSLLQTSVVNTLQYTLHHFILYSALLFTTLHSTLQQVTLVVVVVGEERFPYV